jgi:DNA-binding response OmpR family regulator
VVEDNIDIQRNMASYLECFCALDFAHNGEIGLSLMLNQEFDIIILGVMFPKLDVLTVCRRYQEYASVISPILMLTARDTIVDKELGFCAEANDY